MIHIRTMQLPTKEPNVMYSSMVYGTLVAGTLVFNQPELLVRIHQRHHQPRLRTVSTAGHKVIPGSILLVTLMVVRQRPADHRIAMALKFGVSGDADVRLKVSATAIVRL